MPFYYQDPKTDVWRKVASHMDVRNGDNDALCTLLPQKDPGQLRVVASTSPDNYPVMITTSNSELIFRGEESIVNRRSFLVRDLDTNWWTVVIYSEKSLLE